MQQLEVVAAHFLRWATFELDVAAEVQRGLCCSALCFSLQI